MKKVIAIFLTILVCVSLCGCSPVYDIIDLFYGNEAVKKEERIPRIAFSNGTLFEDSEEEFFPAKDFSEVSSEFSSYRSDIYYNALSPEEQNIYTAFEYAMENSYSNILVDSSLADSTDTLIKVLFFLSLDSPLLEQNLRYEVGDFTTSYPVNILGIYDDYAKFNGFYITVENFNSEMWAKKLEAVKKAEEIVETLPAGLSDFQRAEELYLTLSKSVEYYDYKDKKESETVFPYLYDALITGKTHCDGHANALSLLLRLADIESCEKLYSGEKEEEIGHTWVAFTADGSWYNADSTTSELIPKKACSMGSGFYFAFSDDLCIYKEDYDEVTPPCTESRYMKPDLVTHDIYSEDFLYSTTQTLGKRNPYWALIIVDNYSSTVLEKQMQKIANNTHSSFYWISIDLANNTTAVLIYQPGLIS